MSIFDRHKNTGDYVTRGEAVEYLQGLPTKDDAATVMRALEELDGRVSELENLARTLRGGSLPRRQEAVRTAGADMTSLVTAAQQLRTEAQNQFASLREDGAREFREARNANAELIGALGRKIDTAVSQFVNRDETSAPVQGGTTGVDYGAVAFGLSEIKRNVGDLIRGANVNASGADVAAQYNGTVQYFADVFAKADAEFDADAFKRQAGVTGGGGESGNWTPSHP